MSKIIKKTPQEVLKNLTDLINRYKPKGLTVTMVKNMVENENGDPKNSVNKYVMETIKYFQNKKLVDINKAVGIFNDFWNYWPHKSLGGKSPSELMSEEIKKQKKSKQKTEETKIRVGDSEMSLEEYDFMIKMMEERQKPFKKWLEKEFKPNYFNYLKSKYSKRVCETKRNVCELFFDRCLYIGFIDLEMIRPEYAMFEFPYWWQTHVMWGNLSEIRISGYIKDMFAFINDNYGREIEGLFEIQNNTV